MDHTHEIPSDIAMETVSCDLCGATKFKVWDNARANTLVRCQNCGLIFTNPRISDSKVKDKLIYSANYFEHSSRMTPELIRARQKSYAVERSMIESFIPQGKILDVGCGIGIFMSVFTENWERYGCDVSSYALEEAQKQGITTYHGEFENIDFGENLFDVIVFRASLHHAFFPSKCIEKAFKLLKPNGLLAIIMSNNADGLCGYLFRGHVKSYEQAHNYLFSTDTLKQYLQKYGFTPELIQYPYFGTGYASWTHALKILPYWLYLQYLNITKKKNQQGTYDISSPPCYGNYVSVFARRH